MAVYHLAARTISRASGRSATAAAAYRSGTEIVDERTGEVHDYERRSGVVEAFVIAPGDAPEWVDDRARLWNEVEAAENRRNSTVAREVVVALPAELNSDQRSEAAERFAVWLVERHAVVVDVAIHEPGTNGDQRNHHAHLMLSTREIGPAGFGAKTRELDQRRTGSEHIRAWREAWADVANHCLERAGVAERIDHRSLAEQGVERAPTRHLGPAATGYERRTGRGSLIRVEHEVAEAKRQGVAVEVRAAALEQHEAAASTAAVAVELGQARTERGVGAAHERYEVWRIEQGMAAARERFAESQRQEAQRQRVAEQQREEAERQRAREWPARGRGRDDGGLGL